MAATPQAAVGEVFAAHPIWREEMLHPSFLPGSVRALVEYRTPGLRLLDLDDPHQLVRYNRRPSDIVRRNREMTQELGLQVFLEGEHDGVQWWSYHRPEWTVATLWRANADDGTPHSPFGATMVHDVEPLSIDHPAVGAAADVLNKVIER